MQCQGDSDTNLCIEKIGKRVSYDITVASIKWHQCVTSKKNNILIF